MSILEVSHLSKAYGKLKALDDVSLKIEKGSVYGLLGPNGAGKTTLLRIINSILAFDGGKVLIDGTEAKLGKTTRMIGYMPEERGLYPKMRVKEQIMFFGMLKGADKELLRKNMREYMEIFRISDADGHRRVEELSKGNQQKVQIIATIVHQPKLVIFDEPFSGFDPINGQLLIDLIERLRERESTIILSSHNMAAIEGMATHIGLVNHGRILLNGELESIKESHKDGSYDLIVASPLNQGLLLDSDAIESVAVSDNNLGRKGFGYTVRAKEGKISNDIIDAVATQATIIRFEENLPTLNDIFIKYAK